MTNFRSLIRGCVVGLALGLLAACGAGLKPPDVELVGVRLSGLGLQGAMLQARVSVFNPNRFALEASRVSFDLALLDAPGAAERNWVEVASGVLHEGLRVGSRDTLVLEVPIELRYRDIGSALLAVLLAGDLDYRLSGEVVVVRPVQRVLPFQQFGVVDPSGG